MSENERPSPLKLQIRFALAIAKKDAKIYYIKPPVLIFGFFFPTCLFFAFVLGREIPPHSLLPGLLGMTLFFISSSSTPIIAPWETLGKTLERLVSTPASIPAIIFGDILAGFLYGIFVSILPLCIGMIIFGSEIVIPSLLIFDIVMSAICFSALGSLISTVPTDSPANTVLLSNIVRLPLIFISGVFIPVEKMPGWGKALSAFSPLTYTTDMARHALLGNGHYSILTCVLVLSTFAIIFVTLSIAIHRRSMPRRLAQ